MNLKVGETCHFEGCLVYCQDAVRTIDSTNYRIGEFEASEVLDLTLADESGVIQVTLWREEARSYFPILQEAMAEVPAIHCAKLMLTFVVAKEPKNVPVQSVRVLHSTHLTQLTLKGGHRLVMAPDNRSLVTDFRCLKGRLPCTGHLKGVVVGETRERMTNKGADQILFTLMDRQRRSVSCIAHDVSFDAEVFSEGQEVVIFYAVAQEDLRNTPGSVWIYGNSYVHSLGSVFLPGTASEEIRLLSC